MAICTYAEGPKATTNNWDIRVSVTVKSLFANISWMAGYICIIEIQVYQCSNIISYLLKLAWHISLCLRIRPQT